MAWIESHTTLREHPKTKRLCRLLGINRREAIGLLHILWWWVLDFAPEGDLSGFSDEDIADSIDWEGDAHELLGALRQAGFIDEDHHVHDWDEHAEKWIARRRANAERMRLARAQRNGSSHSKGSAHVQSTFAARAAQNGKSVGLPDQPDQPTNRTNQPDLHPNPPPPAEEGTFPQDVVERISRLPTDLDAAAFHAATESALASLGFTCQREARVADRGDGHEGRLDLVAERRGSRIAFELDDRTPRRKSIAKLAGATDCHFRAVVLRCPADGPLPHVARQITVIGAGRWGDESAQQVALTPATPEDVATWEQARAELSVGMLPANAEKLAALEPIGRAPDGGLHLRAPPWVDGKYIRHMVAKALLDAGDAAGPRVVIVEARPRSTEG